MRIFYLKLKEKIKKITGIGTVRQSDLSLFNALNVMPVSDVFGFDRGTPIDRYYIEKFLRANGKYIKGTVLEVAEREYTRKFGGDKVEKSLVLSFAPGDNVDIVGDLSTGEGIPENIADCFICTQTFPFIFDIQSAARNAVKMLRPGGRLLVTVSGITQISRYDMDRWGHFWSFTDLSLRKLFEQIPEVESVDVETHGNAKVAACFLYGLAQHELSYEDLEYVDRDYQLNITAVIKKRRNEGSR